MTMRSFLLWAAFALAGGSALPESVAALEAPASTPKASVLTLGEVLTRTLQSNPNLTAAAEELRAAEAEQRRANRLPNPELAVTLENVAGDGIYNGTDAAELTVELSQPIELGGKRGLRREAAGIQRDLAANEQGRGRADVLATARQRYIKVLTAQKQLSLAKEQAELTAKSLTAAEERIKAGKSPVIDRLRLQGEFNLARLATEQAERSVKTAKQELAASWDAATPDFDQVAGDLATLPDLPELTEIETTLQQTPEATNRRLATALSTVELAQAKAARIPDPNLTVGWRQFEESNESALLFGISMPLPLFNQGQDGVAAASSHLSSAQAREQSARNELLVQLRVAWQALADARTAADTFNSHIVAGSAEAFTAAEFGYQAGKFGLIELLDAQRALFDARQRQLDAQTAAHLAAIELQRLLGREPAAVATNQPSSL